MIETEIIGHSLQLQKLALMRENNKIPHAILFSGINGIGKKTVALRFFMELFCSSETSPCLACPSCRQIRSGTFPDLIILEPNNKGKIPIGSQENSEEGSVRWLIERISKKSISGRFGVIIDGVEKISPPGQNALLKTIEEPQTGTVLILITSNKSRILPTILSRCSHIAFNPLLDKDVEKILTHINMHPEDSGIINLSGGSVEIARMLADDEILNEIRAVSSEINNHILQNTPLHLNIQAVQKKTGTENLIHILLNLYRHLLMLQIHGSDSSGTTVSPDQLPGEKLEKIIKILLALKKGLSNNLNIKYFLKGMIYSLDSIHDSGTPKI